MQVQCACRLLIDSIVEILVPVFCTKLAKHVEASSTSRLEAVPRTQILYPGDKMDTFVDRKRGLDLEG
jgi:hypothetical protein